MNVNRVFSYLSARWQLLAILVLAFVIRITLALLSDNFNHPDENFQIMEQAHRLVFGYGIIPWEYRFTIRSWIVPGFTTVLLYPFKILGFDNPNTYIPGIKILLSILSLTIVWAAYLIGKRLSSERTGLLAAFFCAIWYEIAYFSIRPLSEVWATIFFMAALAFSFSDNKKEILLSAMLGVMTMAIRVNYIPIVTVLVMINLWRHSSEGKRIYLSSLMAGVILIGIFEIFTVGKPYLSYYNYFYYNSTFFIAGAIGSTLSVTYLWDLAYASFYIYWLIPIIGLFFYNKCRPLLALVAISLISHLITPAQKHQIDYRHIFIVVPMIIIIGAFILEESIKRFKKIKMQKAVLVTTAVISLAFSTAGTLGVIPGQKGAYQNKIFNVYNHNIFYRDPHLSAYRFLNGCSDMAGLYDISELWFRSGGYYYLHRDIPIYYSNTAPPNLDYVSHILTKKEVPALTGFKLIKQYDEYKIYARINNDFQYKRDVNFSRNILQPGIDDRFRSKI
jgi:phosphatidylinositol glycan class B